MLINEIEARYRNQGHENAWAEDFQSLKNSAFMCAYSLIKDACPNIKGNLSPMGVVEYWKADVSNGVWSADFALQGGSKKELEKDWVRVTTPMCRVCLSIDGISVEKRPDNVDDVFVGEITDNTDYSDSFGIIGL